MSSSTPLTTRFGRARIVSHDSNSTRWTTMATGTTPARESRSACSIESRSPERSPGSTIARPASRASRRGQICGSPTGSSSMMTASPCSGSLNAVFAARSASSAPTRSHAGTIATALRRARTAASASVTARAPSPPTTTSV